MSAESADHDVRAGFAAGADAYLPKPFRPRQLVAEMRRLLGSAAG